MTTVPYTAGIHAVTSSTYAVLRPNGSWGLANGGVIVSGTDALLVDTPFDLPLMRAMLTDIHRALPDVRLTGIITTHANGDHCWGNQLLPGVPIYGTAVTAADVHTEIPPAAMTAMTLETPPDSPVGRYMRAFFGRFDFTGIDLVSPTDTFAGSRVVTVGERRIELRDLGPAHSDSDVIAVTDDGVVFAGDLLFIGDHPVMWSGPLDNWIAACRAILDTGAMIIVPGHGPVTDPAGVRRFVDYLRDVDSWSREQCAAGVPVEQAAARFDLTPYPGWGHPERLVLTIGAAYRGMGQDPGPRERLILAMAQQWAATVAA